ncbi:MAG: hypothetical protein G8345_10310 [Magnetococcales bacterium]|nr:hypothetical protein [Magnetococcales bacterium]NGZ27265.1 hypothetical protein [Magnetococcales bacterium]
MTQRLVAQVEIGDNGINLKQHIEGLASLIQKLRQSVNDQPAKRIL